MNKKYFPEISTIVLGIIISGVFSLSVLSFRSYYLTSEKIATKYEERLSVLKDEGDKAKCFADGLISIQGLDSLSMNRFHFLADSLLFQDRFMKYYNANYLLLVSSKVRITISDNIDRINALPEIKEFVIRINEIKELLIDLLEAEKEVWIAFDTYVIKYKSNSLAENELLFKQIDYQLLNYYEKLNAYNTYYIRLLAEKELIDTKRELETNNFDKNVQDHIRIRRLSGLGIIVSLIIIILLIRITINEVIKSKKR